MNYKDSNLKDILITTAGKIKSNNRPTLIIGLGGTGAEALIRTKKLLKDRVLNEESLTAEKQNNVEYLVIDTDIASGNAKYGGVKLKEKYNEFLLLQNADLVHILEKKEILPNRIKDWFDENIPTSRIVDGAGGIRQIGRLILQLNVRRVIETIEDKIKQISLNHSLAKEEINVYICFGIGGGTGSGMFYDIAYITRQIIKNNYGNPNICGVVFLPDVTLSKRSLDIVTKRNVMVNGYAALRELDILMRIESILKNKSNLNNSIQILREDYGDDFFADVNVDIFERCFLFGASDEHRKLGLPPDENALITASETIWNLLISDTANGNPHDINSQFSNINPYLDDIDNEKGDDSDTVVSQSEETAQNGKAAVIEGDFLSRKFTVTGSSSFVFPYDEIFIYILYRFVEYLEESQPREKYSLEEDLAIEFNNIEKILKTNELIDSNKYGKKYSNYKPVSSNKKWEKIKENSDYRKIIIEGEMQFDSINVIEYFKKNGPFCFVNYLTDIKEDYSDLNEKSKEFFKWNLLFKGLYRRYFAQTLSEVKSLSDNLIKSMSIQYRAEKFLRDFANEFSISEVSNDDKQNVILDNEGLEFRVVTPTNIIKFAEENYDFKGDFNKIKIEFYDELYKYPQSWDNVGSDKFINKLLQFFEKQFKKLITKITKEFAINNIDVFDECILKLDENSNIQFPFSPYYLLNDHEEIVTKSLYMPSLFYEVFVDEYRSSRKSTKSSDLKNRIRQITIQSGVSLRDYANLEQYKFAYEHKQNRYGTELIKREDK